MWRVGGSSSRHYAWIRKTADIESLSISASSRQQKKKKRLQIESHFWTLELIKFFEYSLAHGLVNTNLIVEIGWNFFSFITGGPCRPGYYCIEGSQTGTKCPIGTFRADPGAQTQEECENCTAGSFCNSTGLTEVSGPCEQGYYCPRGQSEKAPQEYPCPQGDVFALRLSVFYPIIWPGSQFDSRVVVLR